MLNEKIKRNRQLIFKKRLEFIREFSPKHYETFTKTFEEYSEELFKNWRDEIEKLSENFELR